MQVEISVKEQELGRRKQELEGVQGELSKANSDITEKDRIIQVGFAKNLRIGGC